MNLWSLYRDQFLYLQSKGFEVTAIASPGLEHRRLKQQGINVVSIPMKKIPAPLHDLLALGRLLWFFLNNRFDIVSISTPKASLLAGLAAFITNQNKIIFTVRGRAYENKKGIAKKIFESIDRFICFISDSIFSISNEIKKDFIEKQYCNPKKIFVIGSGSSNGVDLNRFTKNGKLLEQGRLIRQEHGVPIDSICILYSGRIRKDKGINELVTAFSKISENRKDVHLLLQGQFDLDDPLETKTIQAIRQNSYIHCAGWCEDVEKYFCAADIFAFPSHREGFGNVAIEASAMELPVVGFDVVGCRESIVNNVTGILCSKIDSKLFKDAMLKLIEDFKLRHNLGEAGRKRVENEFDSMVIWDQLIQVYHKLLGS